MNLIGTTNEINKITESLESEYEVKGMRRTRLCLELDLEHINDSIHVY